MPEKERKEHPAPQEDNTPAALVLVDTSPRWLYGHTIADDVDPAFGSWCQSLANLVRRLNAVARFLEEQKPAIPVVAVEQEHLRWFRTPHAHMSLALAGLYGDACVKEAARQLRRRGHSIVVIGDLCVWEAPVGPSYPVPVCRAEELWAGIGKWVADLDLHCPISWDGQMLFTSPLGGIP